MKSHLKRAPSLKGAALVKLSQLKVQANNWPQFRSLEEITGILNQVDISSDNWMGNILNIYKMYNDEQKNIDLSVGNVLQTA